MSYQFNPLSLLGLDLVGAAGGSTSYKNPVATEGDLPASGNIAGDVVVVLATDHIYIYDGTSTKWIDTGITLASVVGSTPNSQGVSINQVISGNVVNQQLQLQPADATNPGIVTAGAQTLGGNKTLSGTTNLSGLTASQPLKLDASKNIVSSPIQLGSSEISGVLPVINGGTNSSAVLAGNKAIVSNGTAIVESSVTSTELGYSSGVTSSIQSQINNKQPLDAALTGLSGFNTNGLLTQTATNVFTGRTLTAGSSKASVVNGDGVSGNPTVDVVETNLSLNNIGGTLGIAKGGTNSTAALSGNKAIISNGSAIIESAVTSTELGYISGVTSAIQTQINSKASQTYVDATFIPLSQKGANSGVATLDSSGKVPVSQLPSAVMTYEGTWDASTNTPTLANGTGDAGMVYITTVAGTTNFGAGPITFALGDWVVYDGTIWQKSINSNAVVSVNGQTGVVVLTTTNISEGTNLYYTDARAQAAISGGASTVVTSNLSANLALISNASGKIAVSAVTSTELSYVSGVTSAIQTQINAKADSATAVTLAGVQTLTNKTIDAASNTISNIANANISASAAIALSKIAALSTGKALQSNITTGLIEVSAVTNTELGYLSGVTSAIQTQLNAKADAATAVTLTGIQTLTNKTLTAPAINSPTGIVKADVGLGNVDNTSDATKNAAVATLTNKTLTTPVINSPTGLVKADVGLSNVDNTSDATKNAAIATLTNKTIDATSNTISNIANTNISASAAIALSKLAALSVGKALQSNATTGVIEVSAVSNTELGYLSGVTSAIQTQINGKQPLNSTLTSLAAYNTNGIIVQTSTGTFAGRTITAGSSRISVTNGDGVASNPQLDVSEANLALNNISGTLLLSKGGTGQTTATGAFNVLSPITTKGDLITSDGTNNVRLAAGTNGSVLVADSTQTSGLRYAVIATPSTGDINETSFSASNNQTAYANVTGLAFPIATVRSFDALVSVYINATSSLYEVFKIVGIQKNGPWDISVTSAGDTSGINFSITNQGQIQYQSTNVTGFTSSTIKFRAITTSV